MVSTRGHPTGLPETPASNSKALTPTSNAITPRRATSKVWGHTPSNLVILWLLVSIPLVLWDTAYVLFRPHTMPGGWMHAPFFKPYALYVDIDYIYGWPAFKANNGFTSAQASMNIIETSGYIAYLYIIWVHGRQESGKGRGAPNISALGRLAQPRVLSGSWAVWAVLTVWTVSVMTVSKTVLYALNEGFSGFKHTKHNDMFTLIFLYVLPNGLWIVFPSFMMVVFGRELVEGLDTAAGVQRKKRN